MSPPEQRAPASPEPPEGSEKSASRHLRAIGCGAVGMFGGNLVMLALRYAATIVITRGLGLATLGAFGLVTSIAQSAHLLADAGLSQTNLKLIPHCMAQDDPAGARATAARTLFMGLVASVLMCVGLWLLAPVLAVGFYHRPELVRPLRIASLALPLLDLTSNAVSILQALRNLGPRVWITCVGVPGLAFVGSGVVVLMRGDLTDLVWSYVISAAVGLVAALVVVQRWMGAVPWTGARGVSFGRVLRFTGVLGLAACAQMVLTAADVLVLGHFVVDSDLGVYVAAARTALLVTLPLKAVNAIHPPVISELYSRGDREGLRRTFAVTTRWSTAGAFVLFGGIAIVPTLVMGVFGGGAEAGALLLIVLALGQLVNSATGSVGSLLAMAGGHWLYAVTSWVGAGALLGGLAVASAGWGVLGAAVCAGAVMAGINLVRLLWVWRHLGVHPFDGRYAACFAANAALIAVCAWAARYPGLGPKAAALGVFAAGSLALGLRGWLGHEGLQLLRRTRAAGPETPPAPEADPPGRPEVLDDQEPRPPL